MTPIDLTENAIFMRRLTAMTEEYQRAYGEGNYTYKMLAECCQRLAPPAATEPGEGDWPDAVQQMRDWMMKVGSDWRAAGMPEKKHAVDYLLEYMPKPCTVTPAAPSAEVQSIVMRIQETPSRTALPWSVMDNHDNVIGTFATHTIAANYMEWLSQDFDKWMAYKNPCTVTPAATQTGEEDWPGCRCVACLKLLPPDGNPTPHDRRIMVVCEFCGNKRCPHAWDHRYTCTGSNEPNQTPTVTPAAEQEGGGGVGCDDCGRPYGEPGFPDLIIPKECWHRISPTGDDGGLLCPCCIVARLEKAGIRCEGSFMSGPIESIPPWAMHTMRWMENLRVQGHGWACPDCDRGRDRTPSAGDGGEEVQTSDGEHLGWEPGECPS